VCVCHTIGSISTEVFLISMRDEIESKYRAMSEEELAAEKAKFANRAQEVSEFMIECRKQVVFKMPSFGNDVSYDQATLEMTTVNSWYTSLSSQKKFDKVFGTYPITLWSFNDLKRYATDLMSILTIIAPILKEKRKEPISVESEQLPSPGALL